MASDRYLGDGIRKAPFLIPQERGNVGPNGALGRNHLLQVRIRRPQLPDKIVGGAVLRNSKGNTVI